MAGSLSEKNISRKSVVSRKGEKIKEKSRKSMVRKRLKQSREIETRCQKKRAVGNPWLEKRTVAVTFNSTRGVC